MAATDKDTIYIDIDDEITGIIDKVKASNGKIVALVLPKRASVFQSIVNMKLLKRAADSDKKNLVLITTEAGLLPLAGAAGVHVAKTLTSKPEIPAGPVNSDEDEEVDEDATEELEDEPEPDPKAPVGELAGAALTGAAIAKVAKDDEVETLDLDNSDVATDAASSPAKKAAATPKKDKKLKVPDFDRFRLLLIAGGLALILLIVGFVFANSVLPSATILIKTNASSVNVSMDLNLSTDAKTLDENSNTVPAKLASIPKTYSQQVTTTGQKNNGSKATGKVTLTAVECGVTSPADLPAGAGVSSGGNTYITQENTSFAFDKIKGGCIYFNATSDTNITAQNGGSNYNISSGKFTAAGRSDVSGSGSASGGTDNIVRIVTQNDINSAKSKITVNDEEQKKALSEQLKKDNLYPITATYSAGTPNVTSSPNVGEVADSVTVTENVTYTMFGVKEADLNTLLDNAIKQEVDTDKQKILDNGLNEMVYNVDSMTATSAKLSASTSATVGPDLDTVAIVKDSAGKKPGAVKDKLRTNPDVTDVTVKLSPFWVSSVPSKESKIKVIIAKPAASSNSNSSNAGN